MRYQIRKFGDFWYVCLTSRLRSKPFETRKAAQEFADKLHAAKGL